MSEKYLNIEINNLLNFLLIIVLQSSKESKFYFPFVLQGNGLVVSQNDARVNPLFIVSYIELIQKYSEVFFTSLPKNTIQKVDNFLFCKSIDNCGFNGRIFNSVIKNKKHYKTLAKKMEQILFDQLFVKVCFLLNGDGWDNGLRIMIRSIRRSKFRYHFKDKL